MQRPRGEVVTALKRSARSVGIGLGGACALWGGLYLWEQAAGQNDSLPSEWTLLTKIYVKRGDQQILATNKIEWYEKALETLIKDARGRTVDIANKSEDWVAGYADLLRRTGLAQLESGSSHGIEPLKASTTIPYGSIELRESTAIALYKQTGDEAQLLLGLRASDPALAELDQARVPETISPSSAAIYLELAKRMVASQQYQPALNTFLAVHKALPSRPDPLCYRPAAAGYVGQVLWKLRHREEAQHWLAMSERDALQVRTAACQDCAKTAQAFLAKINK